jgi:hypothetical protein
MVIRAEQLRHLEEVGARRFEDEMVAHLKIFAPPHCEAIGDDGVRQVIRVGIENCKPYGFSMQGPVRFFIELMFMFGSYFDTDIQHAWASEALMDPLVPHEMFRADALHHKMTDYLSAVSGPANEYEKKALRETRSLTLEPLPANTTDMRSQLMSGLKKANPEKCEWLGPDRLGAVVDGGVRVAYASGFTTAREIRLFGVLAFTLGHGFPTDRLYPWISQTLEAGQHPPLFEKLEANWLLHADRLLAYSERR